MAYMLDDVDCDDDDWPMEGHMEQLCPNTDYPGPPRSFGNLATDQKKHINCNTVRNTKIIHNIDITKEEHGTAASMEVDPGLLIHDAILKGNLYQLQILNKLHIDFNTPYNGMHALELALIQQRQDIVQFLLENSANVNCEVTSLTSGHELISVKGNLLHLCISKQLPHHFISLLCHYGCNVNSRNTNGDTPPFTALKTNREPRTVKLLINSGYDPLMKDREQNTLLHVAIIKQNKDVIKLILDYFSFIVDEINRDKADARTSDIINDSDGIHHLYKHQEWSKVTAQEGGDKTICCQTFGDKSSGIGPTLGSCSYCPASQAAGMADITHTHDSDCEEETKIKRPSTNVFKGCLNNLKAQNIARYSAEVQSDIDKYEGMQAVVMSSLGINDLNVHGYAPLHLAVLSGNHDITDMLLQYGAHINRTSMEKYTALHYAVSERDVEMVKLLIRSKCDLNARIAVNKNTPLMQAVRKDGTVKLTRELISAGAALNLQDTNGETALATGVYFGATRRSSLLIKEGADVNMPDFIQHTTPLYWAIFNSRVTITRLLIQAGATLSYKHFRKIPRNIQIMRNKETADWLRHVATNPRSLRELSCVAVRHQLALTRQGRGIVDSIHQMALPKQLQDCLTLET